MLFLFLNAMFGGKDVAIMPRKRDYVACIHVSLYFSLAGLDLVYYQVLYVFYFNLQSAR